MQSTNTKTIATQQVVSQPTIADNDTLWRTARAHLAKLNKVLDKADQHQVALGLTLKTLKDQHQGTWAEWEALLKDELGIGKSRASELMQIADGRKTVTEIQDASVARKAKERSLSVTTGCHGETNDVVTPPPTPAPPPEPSVQTRDPASGTVDHPTPYAAHGLPEPGDEDVGTAASLVPALEADAGARPDQIERINGLVIEVAALRVENAELRRQLAVYQSPIRCDFVEDDGGRKAAGYKGEAAGDCVARSITIATGKTYAEVFEALKAKYAKYLKRLRPDHYERRMRSEPVENGCSEEVSGPYLKSLGWKHTRIKERVYLRAGALPSGRLIVCLRGHYVALIDGVIRDTYDSGRTCKQPVLGYWSHAAEPTIEANTKQADKVTA